MDQLRVNASLEQLSDVIAFVTGKLEEMDCPMRVQMQIEVAVEEIFVNIAQYAYQPGSGEADILVGSIPGGSGVEITFVDSGMPFDPVARTDPDVTLSLEERQIGGLGIFMVKKSMDDLVYERRDGQNRLTIRKSF